MLVQHVTLIASKMCLRKRYHLLNDWTILQSFKEVLVKILFCGLKTKLEAQHYKLYSSCKLLEVINQD